MNNVEREEREREREKLERMHIIRINEHEVAQ
jgi:hypothetical protein